MPKKVHPVKKSIKTKLLGVLILVLFLSLAGHLGIFYYTTANVKQIIQKAITEVFNYENEANQELKNSIVSQFIMIDLQACADYINRKAMDNTLAVEDASDLKEDRGVPEVVVEKDTAGVVTLHQVLEIEKHKPGYVFIMNEDGKIIATEGQSERIAFKQSIEYGRNLFASENTVLVKTAQYIKDTGEESGILKENVDNEEYFFIFHKVSTINCAVVKVLPGDYLDSLVLIIAGKISAFIKTIQHKFISFYNRINYITLIVFVSIILISYVTGSSLSKTFTAPLVQLKEATKYVGKGNLKEITNISTDDEIEELADNFNLMTADLKVYITRLSESISREKAIEEEIKLAARIQKSSIPAGTPSFRPESGADLSACIQPTKIVSGDFYDYFYTDDNHLFFAIGDVSGKSVPAALFMTTTKLLMKRYALMKHSPDEILKNVNDTMTLDNPTCMYATIFCGILDTATGELCYCNGGHTNPLVFDGKRFRYLDVEENMLVGLTEKAEFKSQVLQMQLNDVLFLYSDGVTEAKNTAGEVYSEERLSETLNKSGKDTSGSLITIVKEDVAAFSKDAEQYDDITMLCVKYLGKE